MNKKQVYIFIIILLFVITMWGLTAWHLIKSKEPTNNVNPVVDGTTNGNENDIENNLPITGNDYVIKTNSDTSLRIINEYSTDYFTADKNLLIMFGSWCSHCNDELKDIEKIVEYYKNAKNINVVLIAHEFDDTISDLTRLVEEDFNFGNIEVFIDLNRIIRKSIDPEANSVPISYVVDKSGNVLKKHDNAITLDIAKDLLK